MRAALLLLLLAAPAMAQDAGPPLTGDAFEAIVEGRTFDTHDETGRYGVETFLPDRRAIWRDVTQCLEGTWRTQDAMICFDYQGYSTPFCWTYHSSGDGLVAWADGDQTSLPILLYPGTEVVTCEGYFGV